jgi:predicted esterase
MGFSSGAYFASSLAMRGRLDDVDGYAVFAGGQSLGGKPAVNHHFVPVFVGVCADDPSTAGHSRAFAGALAANGISRSVLEQHVGHGLSHVHFNSALTYLRYMRKQRAAS